MARLPFSEALLKLGIGDIEWARTSKEFANGRCGYCSRRVPPPNECPRDYTAERELAEMGWSHTEVTNPNKRVGLLRRPEKYEAEVRIYSCPSCAKRIGIGFIGSDSETSQVPIDDRERGSNELLSSEELLAPSDPLYWIHKGQLLADGQRFEEAIHCFDKAIERDPMLRIDLAWFGKGNSLAGLGRFEDAILCYDKAIYFASVVSWSSEDVHRITAAAWRSKGVALASIGRAKEAIFCCDKAIELDPQDSTARHIKARCEKQL